MEIPWLSVCIKYSLQAVFGWTDQGNAMSSSWIFYYVWKATDLVSHREITKLSIPRSILYWFIYKMMEIDLETTLLIN